MPDLKRLKIPANPSVLQTQLQTKAARSAYMGHAHVKPAPGVAVLSRALLSNPKK